MELFFFAWLSHFEGLLQLVAFVLKHFNLVVFRSYRRNAFAA